MSNKLILKNMLLLILLHNGYIYIFTYNLVIFLYLETLHLCLHYCYFLSLVILFWLISYFFVFIFSTSSIQPLLFHSFPQFLPFRLSIMPIMRFLSLHLLSSSSSSVPPPSSSSFPPSSSSPLLHHLP